MELNTPLKMQVSALTPLIELESKMVLVFTVVDKPNNDIWLWHQSKDQLGY